MRSDSHSIQPAVGSQTKMKTKILSLSAFLIIGIGFTAFGQPQVMQLDDGTKLTLLGVTSGTRQMAPGYENLATANWLYTPDRPSMVWILAEHPQGKWPSFELLISDEAKTGCVSLEKSTESHVRDGVEIQGFLMHAFPRWNKEMQARVRPYRGAIAEGEFVITNPAPMTAVNWTASPLPVTRSDGDLEVTLTKLVAGAPTPSWRGGSLSPTNDLANQCVHLNFDFRQNGQSTTNWEPWPVQTSDAFGNWSRGLIYPYPTNGVLQVWGPMHDGSNIPPPEHYGMDGYYFQPGLWPNQPWKVRLEFIQRSGFSDDEVVTFTNISVKPGSKKDTDDEWTWDASNTNFTFIAQGTANGVRLKLLPPLMFTNENSSGNPKDVSIVIEADPSFNPKGMNLTVVSATDDQGRDLWSFGGSPWAGHYSIELARAHDDVKSVNLKLALHKSRFVEFTVTPTKQ